MEKDSGSHDISCDLYSWQSLLSACVLYMDLSTPDCLALRALLLTQLLESHRTAAVLQRSRSSPEMEVIKGHLQMVEKVMSQMFEDVKCFVLKRYEEDARGKTIVGWIYTIYIYKPVSCSPFKACFSLKLNHLIYIYVSVKKFSCDSQYGLGGIHLYLYSCSTFIFHIRTSHCQTNLHGPVERPSGPEVSG